jgi:hypothetical protein
MCVFEPKCLLFSFTYGHVYAFFIDSLLTKWAQTALASLKAAKAFDEKPDKGNGFLIETSVEVSGIKIRSR